MIYCPICTSKRIKEKYLVKNYRYYQCNICQTLFIHPFLTKKKLNRYYQEDFEYNAGIINEKQLKKRAIKILNNLYKLHRSGKSLLDIGTGYGIFLDEARKHLSEIKGIEPSKQLFNAAKSDIKKNILNLNLEEFITQNKKKYDFITLIHVIEHLPEPKKIIKQIVSILKPRGILYIETPNINSHLYFAEKQNYTFLTPPDHLYLFSKQSFLKLLFKIENINIEKISTYSYPEHLMGILKKKLQISNNKLQINNKYQITNTKNKHRVFLKQLKYLFFDKFLAPVFTPLLNIGGYGSILELYIRKIT